MAKKTLKQRLKHPKKRLIVAGVLAAILLLASGVWYVHYRSSASKSGGQAGKGSPTATITPDSAGKTKVPETKTNPSSSTPVNSSAGSSSSISLFVVRASQSAAGQPLEIRTVINGTTSGNCNLTLSGPSGQKLQRNASISPQTSYSSCSYDIAASDLSSGDWQMSLVATSGGATSNQVNQTVKVY